MMDFHGPKHVEELLWNENYCKSAFSRIYLKFVNQPVLALKVAFSFLDAV
jgi:hypothetical protein